MLHAARNDTAIRYRRPASCVLIRSLSISLGRATDVMSRELHKDDASHQEWGKATRGWDDGQGKHGGSTSKRWQKDDGKYQGHTSGKAGSSDDHTKQGWQNWTGNRKWVDWKAEGLEKMKYTWMGNKTWPDCREAARTLAIKERADNWLVCPGCGVNLGTTLRAANGSL